MLYSLLLLAHAEQSFVFVGNSYTQYNALPTQVEMTLETSMRGWSDCQCNVVDQRRDDASQSCHSDE